MLDVSYRCVTYPEVIVPYEEGPEVTRPEEKAKEAIKIYQEHLNEPTSDVTLPGGDIEAWSIYQFKFASPQQDALLVTLRIVSEVQSSVTYAKYLGNNVADRVGVTGWTESLFGWNQLFTYRE